MTNELTNLKLRRDYIYQLLAEIEDRRERIFGELDELESQIKGMEWVATSDEREYSDACARVDQQAKQASGK